MNDLMRPALYGAFHKTLPVTKSDKTSKKPYEFVGPICESTDKFITLKKFQVLKEKDLITICDVGAYGMSLSSNYNLRPKPVELLIKGSKIKEKIESGMPVFGICAGMVFLSKNSKDRVVGNVDQPLLDILDEIGRAHV